MIFSAKRDVFLDMLATIAENVKESAQYFVDFKIRNEADLKKFATRMKEFETKGDTYIHEIIVALNKTFITPLEREDILELANTMDDILDGMEQCASRFEMYNITEADEYMITFAQKILESTEEVAKSTKLLNKKKLMDIRPHAIKINDIESQCDDLLRICIKELFTKEKDPIKIIQYKELYEVLESISDSCEDVADTLETIIMRNA
ncbi:hypothetical protein DFP93_11759 [Aneurinibacillus soli]|uniref:Putative pit accessory protein n=1 Tax=Aneurinibacillus soli TaxID=1500254 RepID=A0A0U5BLX5_9BACL|nr:DUF47 domain-containing protein [Aneurinibacillus soli]PYE59488.1 hypothetical protein DFP93_11759 [Aneurinibacillus soli]BAU29182.1 putative pit accessory protein [Aneurinibacillus soli]